MRYKDCSGQAAISAAELFWGVICHQHYQLSHQPYIQMSTSVQRHKERDQTRL